MRFFSLLALAIPALVAATSQGAKHANDNAVDQLRFMSGNDLSEQARAKLDKVRTKVNFDGDDDKCPDLKVLCVKKGDDGDEVVGDIGKQSFCHKGGLSCGQCHTKANEAKCNAKYPVDCALKCYSQGSPL
ncbi:hypothetical protein JCM10213_002906 [Rhodosporidiobolus nylandii]